MEPLEHKRIVAPLEVSYDACLALAEITSAAVAGAAAILGAFVGAVAGGIVDAILARRRETRLAEAGARLLAAQLKTADAKLAAAEVDRVWLKTFQLQMPSWSEYQGVLASNLNGTDFDALAECVPILAQLSDDMQASPAWDDETVGLKINDQMAERFSELRKGAATAYNALAALAGHERVGEQIKDWTI